MSAVAHTARTSRDFYQKIDYIRVFITTQVEPYVTERIETVFPATFKPEGGAAAAADDDDASESNSAIEFI